MKNPCKKHKPKNMPYMAHQSWALARLKAGDKQTQCKKCGYWYFKDEM